MSILPVANPPAELLPRAENDRHGLRWWDVDVSYCVIHMLSLLGLGLEYKATNRRGAGVKSKELTPGKWRYKDEE